MHQYLSLSGLMVACPGYPDIQLRSLSVQASDEVPEELVVQTAREYVNGLGKIGEIMRFQERIIEAIRAPDAEPQQVRDMIIVEMALRQEWFASMNRQKRLGSEILTQGDAILKGKEEILRTLQWKADELGL